MAMPTIFEISESNCSRYHLPKFSHKILNAYNHHDGVVNALLTTPSPLHHSKFYKRLLILSA